MVGEEKMTNCPKCGKPILNGGLFTSPAKFNIRCPWCQATLQINIQPKIVTEVIKLGNGDIPKQEIKQEQTQRFDFPQEMAESINYKPLLTDKPKTMVPLANGMKLVGYLFAEEPEKTEF